MKNLKKILILMSFILVFSTFSSITSVQAASISKTKVTLLNGQSVSLKVNGKKGKVKWSSSKKSVATVNSKGLVKAKKKGTAKITAKIGKKKYTCKVTVQSPKLSKTKLSLKYGKSYTLKLSGTNKKVQWSSSDSHVASVSSKGKITAKGAGSAVITATVLGKRFNCKVTVSGGTTKTPEFSETEARKNIAVTTQVINKDVVVFFRSNYEWLTCIECTCYFYDKSGNPIRVDGSQRAVVEQGRESVIIFNYENTDFSTYEIRYEFSRCGATPNEMSLAKYINISVNRTQYNLILTFNNAYSKPVTEVDVIVKYFDSKNDLIAISTGFSRRIAANSYSINDVSIPYDNDPYLNEEINIDFSRCEIYVSHVYVD